MLSLHALGEVVDDRLISNAADKRLGPWKPGAFLKAAYHGFAQGELATKLAAATAMMENLARDAIKFDCGRDDTLADNLVSEAQHLAVDHAVFLRSKLANAERNIARLKVKLDQWLLVGPMEAVDIVCNLKVVIPTGKPDPLQHGTQAVVDQACQCLRNKKGAGIQRFRQCANAFLIRERIREVMLLFDVDEVGES